ncbi:hypothetical protein ACIQU5_05300 [Streptomyces sp. NPDC090306]|uniref:hypothetical protein n=1 Tax=Streptomyces sp. NPDC090306 TaxID=3365961 RepID=UPI00380E0295
MTNPDDLRLLPWTGPGGKPCYLSTDDSDSYLSRLADNIESIQLGLAAERVEAAHEALDDEHTDAQDLRRLVRGLADSLTAVHRIAHSRTP